MLRKTLGRRVLSLTRLQTLFKEIEAVINSRPLVFVKDEVNSYIPVTPLHFLSLNPKTGNPELDVSVDDDYQPYESTTKKLLQIWPKGQKIVDIF